MTNRIGKLWGALLVSATVLTQGVSAQQAPTTADLKKDIDALKASLTAIQQDLQVIKSMLQGGQPAPAPQNVVLDIANRPSRGQSSAKLTIVEFSDYECPFCGRHVKETWPDIAKDYVETGKAKVVFVDFPLEAIHKNAFKAAEAARCAGEQGKYWEMHDRLFTNQSSLAAWTTHANAVGLDGAKFEACLTSGKFADEIRKDLAVGRAAGVTGTPAFFFGVTDPGSSKIKTLSAMKGAQPYANFKQQIDDLLNRAAK